MNDTPQCTLLDYSAFWFTTDTYATDLVKRTPVGELYKSFKERNQCPYCHAPVTLVLRAILPGSEFEPDEERVVKIWGCSVCGWWHDEFTIHDYAFSGWERIKRRVPYLREFTVDAESLPIRTLCSELILHPDMIHEVAPSKLEKFVGAVMADFFSTEVSVLGRSGDGGIDLVYVHSDTPFAVQVKRRASADSTEGVSLVREFLGACVLSGHRNARIVTTATKFTRGAVTAAQAAVDRGLVDSFDLIARDTLLEYFRFSALANKFPWTPIVRGWLNDWTDCAGVHIDANDDFIR